MSDEWTKKEIVGFLTVGIVFSTIVYFFSLAIFAWVLMLILGALHSYIAWIPALGYWPTFFVSWLLFIIAGIFKSPPLRG